MKYRQQEIIKLFNLSPQGQKNWQVGDCPYCGSHGKFGIKFDVYFKGKLLSNYNCFKCQKHNVVYQLLSDFNRLDLVDIQYINIEKKWEEKHLYPEIQELNCTMQEYPIPIGYKRVKSHPYLISRGFDQRFFDIHNVGIAPLDPKIGNKYVVFLLEDENKCVGWIKRSIYSKEYIEQKELEGKKILRWGNSKNAEFEKYLYGLDECTKNTHTVIIVESITSKQNVDKILNLYSRQDIKCLVTFGKKISLYQVKRLLDLSIKSLILIYDPDAVGQSKQYGIELEKYFDVNVGHIRDIKKDPGDLTLEEMEYVLNNLEKPLIYNINKLQKKSLYGTR